MPKEAIMSQQADDPKALHPETLRAASNSIMNDEKKRNEFLADPAAFLKEAGVTIRGKVDLSERDKEIIKMVADPEVAAIYKSGDIARLSSVLRQRYSGLVNDPSRIAWTVADFEVAIEAVAIAVGVFVAPLRAPDDFSEIARLEAVFTARIDALERKVADLSAKVAGRPGG
jgi:hypothetical protein